MVAVIGAPVAPSTVTPTAGAPAPTAAPPQSRGRVRRDGPPVRFWRGVVLGLAGLYFLGPVLVAFWFTVDGADGPSLAAYTRIFTATGFVDAMTSSLLLGLISVAITLALMVPTMLLVHLRLPRARPYVEVFSLLPLVIPPVALVVGVRGVLGWGNGSEFVEVSAVFTALQDKSLPLVLALMYVVIALPFTYRSLDAGLRGSKVTVLVEAALNLGARWPTVLWRVVLPALRTSLLNAGFLAFALVMGEYTIAKILIFPTFPVWLAQSGATDGQLQVALALLSLAVTWALLLIVVAVAGRTRKAKP
ncbi:putative spermidine/putrescine transport system permease protein [Rhodococcus sp. PvR044]|jgi:putative spermidine/putrescine transport system permease protein|uniref:ABC transporter permease n=1 Tax=Rhodococcus TaxID=1827 RepID=UPI0022B3A245|nr:ABC transporter permease subunit [Rhodococcus maanshanensis]MCZ4554888.1 ABC transporter permease subunit [Rhodococcus maanshanensis]